MPRKSVHAWVAAIPLLLMPLHAHAADLKIMVSGAMAHAIREIAEDFVRRNGDTLDFTVGTTGVLQDKVRAGEKPDLIEMTSGGMDALEKEQRVLPGSRVELARANIGIAVGDGAAQPDISTPASLKQTLLSARAIAYIDPKTGGQAGAAIVRLLQRLGIAEEAAKKSVYGKTGAEALQKTADGRADVAIAFISEILPIKSVKLVGPLPAALQDPSSFAGAIGAGSANPQAARALLQEISSARAAQIIRQAGLEPLH